MSRGSSSLNPVSIVKITTLILFCFSLFIKRLIINRFILRSFIFYILKPHKVFSLFHLDAGRTYRLLLEPLARDFRRGSRMRYASLGRMRMQASFSTFFYRQTLPTSLPHFLLIQTHSFVTRLLDRSARKKV